MNNNNITKFTVFAPPKTQVVTEASVAGSLSSAAVREQMSAKNLFLEGPLSIGAWDIAKLFLAISARMFALSWAESLAWYAMCVMMTYLTNVWKLDLTQAAAIVNVFTGAANIMPLGMSVLADAYLGHYCMVLLANLAYSFGLSFLAMSTLAVVSDDTGNCKGYKPDCIGDTQKALFFTALVLIAAGKSGNLTSIKSFRNQQQMEIKRLGDQEVERKMPWKLAAMLAVILLPIFGGIALPLIKPWSVRFGIPAICTIAATLLFMSGSSSYKHHQPQGSPLTTVSRVFVASASKIFCRLPQDANQLYEKHQPSQGLRFVPHTRSLRFLDKAAIIVPTQPVEHQEQSRWKLCRVTEVEETKIFIRMIPIWMTFTMCGVVSSIGETYFLEQANHMNRKVGKLKVPLTMLPIFYKIAKSTLGKLYVKVAEKFTEKGSGKYVAPVGNIAAMLFSILCCITAAKVETMRLEVIKNHMLLDKPNHKIPMSMFWLLPQFLFLGALDGISGKSIPDFFTSQVPASMRPLMEIFTWVAFGAGTMGSVLSVHVVGKVSERRGKPSWFQDTLNESHLNNYYWVLTIWSSINLVLYILVAIRYPYQDPPRDRVDLNQVELL